MPILNQHAIAALSDEALASEVTFHRTRMQRQGGTLAGYQRTYVTCAGWFYRGDHEYLIAMLNEQHRRTEADSVRYACGCRPGGTLTPSMRAIAPLIVCGNHGTQPPH